MRTKINLGFIIITLLVWVICLYTIFSSLSVQKLFNKLNDDIVLGAITMAKMKYEATDIRSWTLTYILRGNVVRNEKTIKEWLQESWSNLENEAQIHYEHESHIGMEEQQSAEKIVKLSQKLISSSIEIIDLKDQGCESDILFEKIKEDFRSAFYPLREVLDEHAAIHIEELTAAPIKAQSKYRSAVLYIALLGIVVTFLFLFFTLFINKIITNYITGRDLSEQALKESEEKFRTLTENINVGIYRNTVGAKGKFIEVNPAIVKMFGFKNKKEFLAYNVSELYLHSEERKKFSDKMLKKGFVKDEELLLKKKDGSPFVGSISAVTIKGNDGNVQFYDGIIEDITERKKVEEKLKVLSQAVTSSIDGLAMGDLNSKITYVNKAFTKMFGYSKEELIGKE
ncbi:MAG: PAS domain S-box protein, partial [Candidatus Cloacimonetes bacterium]|nr:PAS domain S-box protein [Candidatus Cloacimonadota bacterium]